MKNCSKCNKIVYPTEELKCLDKTWHKGCFKCTKCSMTLNMKNYKGYEKMPYCNAHYPKTNFTAVADTPENLRLAQNTQKQSQVAYHKEFEQEKGKFQAVADDPETLRVKKNTQNISNVCYTNQPAKNQEMEGMRQNMSHQDFPQRSAPEYNTNEPPTAKGTPYSARGSGMSTIYSSEGKVEAEPQRSVGSINDYDPLNEKWGSLDTGYKPQSSTNQRAEWEESVPPPSNQNMGVQRPPSQHQAATPQKNTVNPLSNVPREPQQSYQQHQPPIQQQQPQYAPPPAEPTPAPAPAKQANPLAGVVFQAMYDYSKNDEEEVSFREDDFILDCEPIDDGWIYGRVERTGEHGWIPSNYVRRIESR